MFPHLESLFLDGITFRRTSNGDTSQHGGDLEEFIISHKATLQLLQLQHCMSEFDEFGDVRQWSIIWERFAKELTRLVCFSVKMKGKGMPPKIAGDYGQVDKEVASFFASDDLEGEDGFAESDMAALEKLKAVVGMRRADQAHTCRYCTISTSPSVSSDLFG